MGGNGSKALVFKRLVVLDPGFERINSISLGEKDLQQSIDLLRRTALKDDVVF